MPNTEAITDEQVMQHLINQGLAPVDPEGVEVTGQTDQTPALELVTDEDRTDLTEPIAITETPSVAATRILEVATMTADQLVAEATAEAAALVAAAKAEAAERLDAITAEVEQVASDLARRTNEQNAELERERTTAMNQLADEKSVLQREIDALHQQETESRTRLRDYLNGQLALLGDDAEHDDAPIAVAS